MRLSQVFSGCVREFQWSNCGFAHSPANNFIKSQWQSRTRSKWYLAYRWILALYFVITVIVSASARTGGVYYLIYLTNWGMMLCAATTLYGAILVSIWYCHPSYMGEFV